METKNPQNIDSNDDKNTSNASSKTRASNRSVNLIMDLPKLSTKLHITASDIILSILEIFTFNKRYNYECSNNTKAFWDRVVKEGILKKIFKNFKSETLRKYWKIIRQTGDNDKYIEVVKQNENFINNNGFKLLPIVNTISTFITSPPKNQNFEEYFIEMNPKEVKEIKQREKMKKEIDKINKKKKEKEFNNECLIKKEKEELKEKQILEHQEKLRQRQQEWESKN